MAGPPPSSGRIKKGEVRNPRGRSEKSRALTKMRRMTGSDLADLTSTLLDGNLEKLAATLQDPSATFMQRLTAKLLTDCWKKGDIAIYRAILDRVVGRPKESASVEITGADGGPLQVSGMSDEDIEAKLKEIEERNAKVGLRNK